MLARRGPVLTLVHVLLAVLAGVAWRAGAGAGPRHAVGVAARGAPARVQHALIVQMAAQSSLATRALALVPPNLPQRFTEEK